MASTADGIGVTSGQSWIPTTFSEWLYVRLEVGALSVNALWALRAGRWGWRCGPVGLGWGAIVLGITFLALLRQVALER